MTEFIQTASPYGSIILLPRAVADRPPREGPYRDPALLALNPEQIKLLDDNDVIDALAAARRRRAQTEALEYRLLARLDEVREGSRYVPDEAALEMRVTRNTASRRVATGRALASRMPGVLEAMDEGELDGYTASTLVDICHGLDDTAAREVDDRLADRRARGKLNLTDPTALRRTARRVANAVDPAAAAARARAARSDRKVELMAREHAMSTLYVDLPAEVAASAYARIDADARRLRNAGDQRTLDQLRADITGELLTGGGGAGGAGGGKAVVFVHMPVDTALTMSDAGCELAGYGPIPGAVAREIMANPNSVLRKVLVDPTTGEIKGLGRTRRRPNQALRDLVAVRDRECRFCHRPAHACHLDHLAEWMADFGRTDPENLDAKCEHDHYLKDHPQWDLGTDPKTRDAVITTPAKRSYHRPRENILEPEPPPPKRHPLPKDPPF